MPCPNDRRVPASGPRAGAVGSWRPHPPRLPFLLAAVVIAGWGEAGARGGTPADPARTPTWADEFDVPGAPDPANWDYEVGFVRNEEAQSYTRDRRANVVVEGGHLVLTALHEPWETPEGPAAYTSGSVTTRGRRDFLHGRLEIRAKIPAGRGIWPAIWLRGSDPAKRWPDCGEIDLMEYVGFDPHTLHVNIHTTRYNHVQHTNRGRKVPVPDAAHDWHVYALQWQGDALEFFLDGKRVFTFPNEGTGPEVWPYDAPHHLILNVAVGGTWGGREGIDDGIFPQRMLVDYVRYWRADP